MNKEYIRSVVVVVCICLVMGLALALCYHITQPRIEANELKKLNEAIRELFPASAGDPIEIALTPDAPKTLKNLYKTADGKGYVAKINTNSGFGQSTFTVGIDAATMKIVGIKCISYGDSVGLDDGYLPSYSGQDKALADVDSSASPAKKTKATIEAAVRDVFTYLENTEFEEVAQ